MSTGKLGPHVILPTPPAREWARVAGIVKTIDDLTVLHDAPDDAIRIFRHYDKNESSTDADAVTWNLLNTIAGYNHRNLYLQIWTGAHPAPAVLVEAVRVCHKAGYKTLGSSWYTGDYTQEDWDNATLADVDAYGPQCYFGKQGFTLDHAVHYREFWKPGQRMVLIPECGMDNVEGGTAGWKNNSGLTGTQYADLLVAYSKEISKDNYVGGACVFTAGPTDK